MIVAVVGKLEGIQSGQLGVKVGEEARMPELLAPQQSYSISKKA